ncbi:MAG: NAD(P)/FAD-dependent oxidoreductase [Chloroflexi bacterium]|nr:NAD(P)/FAD-dependent oxidoreductase [Chloroflexota bacterium]
MRAAIVGGGITGMSAADTLSAQGVEVTLYESEATLGGLAASFRVDGVLLERFYHHLFTSDTAMVDVIERMGLIDRFEWLPTNNSYYAGRTYRLSTPIDLLRFTRISFFERIRLGILYLRSASLGDWQPLENLTAREWLIRQVGENTYRVVWEPLIRAKFGAYADQISAVWIWNKLKLRGSSRGKGQEERLGYLRGGFGQALEAWEAELRRRGVRIELNTPVERVLSADGQATGVRTAAGDEAYDQVLVTTAPDVLLSIAPDLPADYRARLGQIDYLANVCLTMQLDRKLSDTYWLNIGVQEMPFTGIIEHTNMQRSEIYGGAHLVYISRYLAHTEPSYAKSAEELLDEYLPHLQTIYPGFERSWVKNLWDWRARYTQPVIVRNYSQLLPPPETPVRNLWLACMAQIYPQDRGMNYAVVSGREAGERILERLGITPAP